MKKNLSLRFFSAMLSSSWAYQEIKIDNLKSNVEDASKAPLVAVIDTGCDLLHFEIREAIWVNPGETGRDSKGRDKDSNGIDDDHNGYIDDVHGWDFVKNSPRLKDNHGHGTHVAGIIHTIAPKSRLMILRYYDAEISAQKSIEFTAASIRYAVEMGAQIINYSGGGGSSSAIEKNALLYAESKGVLVVAAAGNNSSDNDLVPYFPASYDLTNILSVSAIGPHLLPIESSNFGEQSVDISAPGENVLSLLPKQSVGTMTGTSQATAITTGAIAYWMSQRGFGQAPFITIEQVKATSEKVNCKNCDPFKLKPKLNLDRLVRMSNELRTEGSSTAALDALEINTDLGALNLP